MVTIEDVVAQLVKQTESGTLEWKPAYDSSDTTPSSWSVINEDCRFLVFSKSAILMINSHTVGQGAEVGSLLEVLRTKFNQKNTTTDEMLAIALDCLTKQSK